MARTAIAVQQVLRNQGAALTMVAADQANGMKFANDGQTVLVVQNADSGSHTVTVASVACSHGRTGDQVVTVAAGKTAIIGPFQADAFNQAGGVVNVDFSSATSMTIGARTQ